MRIVIAPDKFKGSLPATQVAAAIAAGLRAGPTGAMPELPEPERAGPDLVTIPVADGGDGTVDAAGITAVYTLSELESDPARCVAGASRLLRRVGRMIAGDWLPQGARS